MNLNVENDQSGLLRLPSLKIVGKPYEEAGKLIIVVASVRPFVKTPCCLWGVTKNGTKTIRYRDFGVQKQETWLEIKRQRFICALCGKTHYEPLPDLDSEFRVTKRFRAQIEKDAVDDTFAKTSKDNAVDVTLVKRIFYAYAKPIVDSYKPDMPEWFKRDPELLAFIDALNIDAESGFGAFDRNDAFADEDDGVLADC